MPTHDISPDIRLHYGEEPNLIGILDKRNGNILILTNEEVGDLSDFLSLYLEMKTVEGTVLDD